MDEAMATAEKVYLAKTVPVFIYANGEGLPWCIPA